MQNTKTDKRPIRIIDLIGKSQNGDFVLPEIQREFVWDLDRITELWDSIYRGYPIGQLLFWEADTEIPVYEFFDYNTTEKYLFVNKKPEWKHGTPSFARGKTIVLDGQQRITSLFLGLSPDGICIKKRSNSPLEKNYLCIYVGNGDAVGDNDIDLFAWKKEKESAEYLSLDLAMSSKRQTATIRRLKEVLRSKTNAVPVEYVRSSSISDVIEIFRRLNNSGRNMSKTELFIAMWFGNKESKGLRKELDALREEFGADFNIKDSTIIQILMSVFGDASSRSGSSSKSSFENYGDIASGMSRLQKAVQETVRFLHDDCGIYTNDEMSSHSLFVPLVHLFYKKECDISQQLRNELRCFTYRALLFDLFSKSTYTTLASLKKTVDELRDECFIEHLSSSIQDLIFGDYKEKDRQWLNNKIRDDLLRKKKGSKTNQILLLLRQESANTKDGLVFDQDHLIAIDLFKKKSTARALENDDDSRFGIRQNGVISDKYRFTRADANKWGKISNKKKNIELANTLPNLWLLESSKNRGKGKKLLNIWYDEIDSDEQKQFWKDVMLQSNSSDYLKITNFENIFKDRNEALFDEIRHLIRLPQKRQE